MRNWDEFPSDYRHAQVTAVLDAVHAGESVSVVGLSGSGKSNLLGYLAYRCSTETHPLLLLDCNRLLEHTAPALLRLARQALGDTEAATADPQAELDALSRTISGRLETAQSLGLLLDRFDIFTDPPHERLFNALRALRDAHKYRLAYVVATRRPLPQDGEMAELFYAHTLWLGPLSESDARWNVARFAARHGETWDEPTVQAIIDVSRRYPSLLKAACQAFSDGAPVDALAEHPAVQARVTEFWRDDPADEHLVASDLGDHPLLLAGRGPLVDEGELTAKERVLYDYFLAHPNQVCEKDELILAVWPEDAVYEEGVRDSSLAQLVRRLRVKIEPDPSEPRFIETVPSRGYVYRPGAASSASAAAN